ncbi:hypothetical protein ACIBCA_11850 [Kitasatospora sp. NPDC051170]|uniref:hypothetical protein n=1 Tax=Kitasatospora sp. NPDC051170 TaxID=3364056 RepID=UPI0037A02F85
MGTTDSTASAPRTPPATGRRTGAPVPEAGGAPLGAAARLARFLPALAAYGLLVALLLASHTSAGDIARYTFYAAWGVLLPGTLVFRALRRRPHTLIEDLAFGAVVGLVLELVAWAVLVGLGLQSVATAWPLAVVVPFAAVPRLRRHWFPRGHRRTSTGWNWSVAGVVGGTSAYLYAVALSRNPILPDAESTRQYIDLPYLLSLAGNAKHNVPLTFPQAAGEPLHYHWFTFVHMAMTDMVGHIDLPVVQMRLMVPALVALAMVITAVVGHRLSGRAWVGPVAALLVFAVGEFNAVYPLNTQSWPFGAPLVPLMAWTSLSLTYSQPLLMALIGVVADALRRDGGGSDDSDGPDDSDDPDGSDGSDDEAVPRLGRGGYVLVAMFALASSAAKASLLPVTLAGLAFAGLMVLLATRRIPWTIVRLGAIVGGAQLFATAVLFRFESYGLEVLPFGNIERYWADPQNSRGAAVQAVVVAATLVAFLLNHQLRLVGMLPLMWRRRLRLEPVQWFLLGGAVAGPAAYLVVNGFNASYFTLAGLPFGVLLSAWGYCEVFERAALPARGKAALAAGTLVFVGLLTYGVYEYSGDWARFALDAIGDSAGTESYTLLVPLLAAAAALAGVALVGGLLWWAAGRALPALRRRGGLVLLTAALVAGAPSLLLDVQQARQVTWDGAWPMPASQVEAARWVRAHSRPSDILVTNDHYRSNAEYGAAGEAGWNPLSFWLSGYSERSVLVEGWAYSPRLMSQKTAVFWDQPLLKLNDDAIFRPTADILRELRDRYHVRYLVADRKPTPESPLLKTLATPVFDNGRMAVYELS